jgi:hypothetical protein
LQEFNVFAGKGELITKAGGRLPLTYRMVATHGVGRAGNLVCDTSTIDPAAFFDQMELICDDGATVTIAVTYHSERHIGFIGRIRQQ